MFRRQDPSPKPDQAAAPLGQATSLTLPAAEGLAPLGDGLVDADETVETPPPGGSYTEIVVASPSVDSVSPSGDSLPPSEELASPSEQELLPSATSLQHSLNPDQVAY